MRPLSDITRQVSIGQDEIEMKTYIMGALSEMLNHMLYYDGKHLVLEEDKDIRAFSIDSGQHREVELGELIRVTFDGEDMNKENLPEFIKSVVTKDKL